MNAAPGFRKQAVLKELARVIPSDCLIFLEEEIVAYECDALTAFRQNPWAVTLPRTEAQVVAILKVCKEMGICVVPRGGGTSLSGGARPIDGSVVVSLSRMKGIVRLDPLACTATVEPGVRNQSISDAASIHGLYYAPDPSSQLACTIGGNIAENAGGLHCLKYGVTLNNVLHVRGVSMDGDIIEVGSLAGEAPGLDLMPLVVGSEGMLALVTQVTVRLLPKPPHVQVMLVSFDDVAKAANAVAGVISAGIIPAALEMMDQGAAHAIEACIHPGYDMNAQAILICEADGTQEQVAEEIARMTEIFLSLGATDCKVSQSAAEREGYWKGRKAALTAASQIAPDCYVMDGVIPRRMIAPVLEQIDKLQAKHGLRCINVFHAGDGNLHPIVCYDGSIEGQWERAEHFGEDILAACIEAGGSVSGEHGVGVEKLDAMCSQFGTQEMAMFHRIKAAFDPAGLLNPDKAIPSLSRCAEHGRMHINQGNFPRPDLPRF